jgi:hypothetical protein
LWRTGECAEGLSDGVPMNDDANGAISKQSPYAPLTNDDDDSERKLGARQRGDDTTTLLRTTRGHQSMISDETRSLGWTTYGVAWTATARLASG